MRAQSNSTPHGLDDRETEPAGPHRGRQGFDGGIPYSDCTYQPVRAINASGGDHIDVVIEWRPGVYSGVNKTDDNPGGNSANPPAPYADLRRASCVSGIWGGVSLDGTCMAQESGHNFGLEPPGSPHYNDPNDPGHSKDGPLGDPYAYDFVHHRPLAVGPLGFSAAAPRWSSSTTRPMGRAGRSRSPIL
jgi:hypothetical protein